MSERAKFMLEIAAKYIREHYDEGIIFYDDAECDGACVADDCESASDELQATLSALQEQNRTLREALADPSAVHANMLRGTIAKPSVAQIVHLYAGEVVATTKQEGGE